MHAAESKKWLKSRVAGTFKYIYMMHNRLKNEALAKSGVLQIGRHTYGEPIVHIYKGSEAFVKIGSFCSISPGVMFITGGIHPTDWVSLYPFRARFNLDGKFRDGMPKTNGDIIMGNDVWIGTEAMILSGVHIGDSAVIAARSVVARDVPAYSIVAGVPAKIIKKRFSAEEIESLQAIKWWEWDDDEIIKAVPLLSSNNINNFITYAMERKQNRKHYKY